MGTFRFNGFTIIILKDKVVAFQGHLSFSFKTLEDALDVLIQ